MKLHSIIFFTLSVFPASISLTIPVVSYAAVPSQSRVPASSPANSPANSLSSSLASSLTSSLTSSLAKTKAALNMPTDERLEELQDQGPQGYRNLVEIMKDDGLSVESRWRAVTAAAEVGGDESIPDLEYALSSKDWFLRNAGLIGAQNVDRQLAINWAKKLLDDKALVVRVAAVSVLDELNDKSSIMLLWKTLAARENFQGRESLYIRRRIAEALTHLESPGSEGRFIALLKDPDDTLHPASIVALERLTGLRFGADDHDSLPVRRSRWLKWWKERSLGH